MSPITHVFAYVSSAVYVMLVNTAMNVANGRFLVTHQNQWRVRLMIAGSRGAVLLCDMDVLSTIV